MKGTALVIIRDDTGALVDSFRADLPDLEPFRNQIRDVLGLEAEVQELEDDEQLEDEQLEDEQLEGNGETIAPPVPRRRHRR